LLFPKARQMDLYIMCLVRATTVTKLKTRDEHRHIFDRIFFFLRDLGVAVLRLSGQSPSMFRFENIFWSVHGAINIKIFLITSSKEIGMGTKNVGFNVIVLFFLEF
ncbi:hypothetical protein ACJX0J_020449, partial [Zea mays]